MTSTPTRPVDNVVITTKGLQDRNINILDGTTVENKGKLIQEYLTLPFVYFVIIFTTKCFIALFVVFELIFLNKVYCIKSYELFSEIIQNGFSSEFRIINFPL